MSHHTVTATFSAPPEDAFAYLADIDNLPEWATEFARELRLVDGRYKVVNGLGEFFFEIHADRDSGVIDMHAGCGSHKLIPRLLERCRSLEDRGARRRGFGRVASPDAHSTSAA